MALANYALITVAEAREELGIDSAATADTAALESVIALATATIEKHLDRSLRYRGTALVDLMDVRPEDGRTDFIATIDRPIFEIVSIKEANQRGTGDFWASITALTEGTDYYVDKARGRIERLANGWSQSMRSAEVDWWPSGQLSAPPARGWGRWVRVEYKAGFEGQDAQPTEAEPLPAIFQQVCRELVALKWREIKRGEQGVTGVTNELGNFQRIGPAKLQPQHEAALRDEKQTDLSANTTRDKAF